jgi:hypothetical protein
LDLVIPQVCPTYSILTSFQTLSKTYISLP